MKNITIRQEISETVLSGIHIYNYECSRKQQGLVMCDNDTQFLEFIDRSE